MSSDVEFMNDCGLTDQFGNFNFSGGNRPNEGMAKEHASMVAEYDDVVFTPSKPKPVKRDRMNEVVPLSSYGDDVNCKYR